MAALTIERKTPKLGQDVLPSFPTNNGIPVEASTKIYAGALVAKNAAGNAVPAAATLGLTVVGVAEKTVDNSSGSAGAQTIVPRSGVFQFDNGSSGDAIAAKHAGQVCYASDDHTLNLTSSAGSRPAAGIIVDFDTNGVWALIGLVAPQLLLQAPYASFEKAAADGAAATATAETAFGRTAYPLQVGGAFFSPSAALTGDATNNAVITVGWRNGSGGALQTLATLTTTASWTAFTPVSLGAITNAAVPAGAVFTVSIAKGGTGVVVPSGQLVIV